MFGAPGDPEDGWFSFTNASSNDLNRLPKDQRESLLAYADALEDPEYLKYTMGDKFPIENKRFYKKPLDKYNLE